MIYRNLFIISILAYCFTLNVLAQTGEKTVKIPETIAVEGGSFQMGDAEGDADEKPVHQVTVNDFRIGKYEVTVAEYRNYCENTGRSMPAAPSWGWQDDHPMVNITWWDASSYCLWLSRMSKQKFRLPTEAEWEYAARGGNKSLNLPYSGGKSIDKVGWYVNNMRESTTKSVGKLAPNELGIYDMSGNAWEWCSDFFAEDYYANAASINPRGPEKGLFHVIRGGSWFDGYNQCKVSFRRNGSPMDLLGNLGFRVLQEAAQ